eukprot:3628038-Rhodomonas_salina.2
MLAQSCGFDFAAVLTIPKSLQGVKDYLACADCVSFIARVVEELMCFSSQHSVERMVGCENDKGCVVQAPTTFDSCKRLKRQRSLGSRIFWGATTAFPSLCCWNLKCKSDLALGLAMLLTST